MMKVSALILRFARNTMVAAAIAFAIIGSSDGCAAVTNAQCPKYQDNNYIWITLVQSVKPGLSLYLPSRVTIFMPTDDAFASLPDKFVQCLLEEDNKQVLTDFLLYHMVSGIVHVSGIVQLTHKFWGGKNIRTLL